jgi:opacity protein-like surface antigen
MKRGCWAFIFAVAVATPVHAGNLDLRLGAFQPRANTGAGNDLFRDDSELYTVSKSDWLGFSGGAQYNFKIARNVEIGLGIDGYSRSLDTAYRDYEHPGSGRDIQQTLQIDIVPVSAELRFTPTGRHVRIAPWIGVGGDLFYYKYEEFGEFVDFDRASLPIIEDSFISEGVSGGFHVSAGLRFAITDDVGFIAGARYQWGKADMKDDFRGNKLDLTGATYTAGVNIRF